MGRLVWEKQTKLAGTFSSGARITDWRGVTLFTSSIDEAHGKTR